MSLCVQELLSSTRFYLNSCSHSGISAHNGSSPFYFVFGFGWLGSATRVGSKQLEHDTGTGWDSFPLRSSLSRVLLSLDTVVVGEVDELEEDVG